MTYSRLLIFLTCLVALFVVSCSSGSNGSNDSTNAAPSRYFANVPFVVDWPDVLVTGENIAEDSNMIALYFASFNGIPWDAFINGTAIPAGITDHVEETATLVDSLDLPVFLAVTPLGGDYKTLAPDTVVDNYPNTSVCGDLALRPDWDDLRAAYGAYIEYLVARFNPKFLALSIELSQYFLDAENRLDQACVDNWAALQDMFNEIYTTQKALRPDMQIMHTFQADAMWNAKSDTADCFDYLEACVIEKVALVSGLSMDMFGLSVYPIWSYVTNANTLPDNYISIFQRESGHPLAIGETGWQHSTMKLDDVSDPPNCINLLPSSEALQSWWMDRLLTEAETLDMPLVVWWSNHDTMPEEVGASCVCSTGSSWCSLLNSELPIADLGWRFFGSMGLRDYDGNPRQCLSAWQNAVAAAAP